MDASQGQMQKLRIRYEVTVVCVAEKMRHEKSVEAGVKECKAEVRLRKAPSSTSGAGVTVALKSASGEWSPLQQMWLESGVFGVGGADSWHPESPCVPICRSEHVEGANRAGNLQQKRRHRRKCGNSHGKLDHRTNAHVQLWITNVGQLNFTSIDYASCC